MTRRPDPVPVPDAVLRADFPRLTGRPVTEAHARVCHDRGHAVWTINGRPQGVCPRCGEITEDDLT
jgi:hypothetical protein